MSFKKIVIIGFFVVFALISVISIFKRKEKDTIYEAKTNFLQEVKVDKKEIEKKEKDPEILPFDVDIVDKLFVTDSTKLPIVETIVYSSRVPWLQGKNAWISDYASYFKTTRHFIARSLNKKPDYFTQKVSSGDRFNVLKKDVKFHLLIDISKLKMRFYALHQDKRYLLKTYNVGLGRKDGKKESGCLTPQGKFLIGSKVAIYKPQVMGYFKDRKIEMVKVFGTRWIPFEKEVEACTDGAKGYGFHGSPWHFDATSKVLKEDRSKIGTYDSDGCIRLYQEDIEEVFAIIISRPTIVEIVKDFKDANLN